VLLGDAQPVAEVRYRDPLGGAFTPLVLRFVDPRQAQREVVGGVAGPSCAAVVRVCEDVVPRVEEDESVGERLTEARARGALVVALLARGPKGYATDSTSRHDGLPRLALRKARRLWRVQ
jgi:hypothetical protein